LSGNSNTGTLTNGPFYSGSNGGTLVFDGSNDHIVPTGLTDSFFQGNWTISFWVNFDTINTTSVDSSDKVLLQHGSFGTRTALHLNQRNSRLYFGMFFDDLSGTRTLSTGTWYHIVFTLNNTTYAKQIYINGVLDNSHTGGGAYTGTGNNAKIGQSVSANGVNFDGFMSSCVFYNRVLSASEVQQNFNATRGRFGV